MRNNLDLIRELEQEAARFKLVALALTFDELTEFVFNNDERKVEKLAIILRWYSWLARLLSHSRVRFGAAESQQLHETNLLGVAVRFLTVVPFGLIAALTAHSLAVCPLLQLRAAAAPNAFGTPPTSWRT